MGFRDGMSSTCRNPRTASSWLGPMPASSAGTVPTGSRMERSSSRETKTSYVVRKGKRTKVETTVMVPAVRSTRGCSDVDASGSVWYAATANGVYASADQGATWEGGPVLGKAEYRAVAASGPMVVAAQRTALAWSEDGGKNWQPLGHAAEADLAAIHRYGRQRKPVAGRP